MWGAENSAYKLEFRISDYLYSEVIYSALGNLTKDEMMQNKLDRLLFKCCKEGLSYIKWFVKDKLFYTTQFNKGWQAV